MIDALIRRLFPGIPQEMLGALGTVESPLKRAVIAGYYALAVAQRELGEEALSDWPQRQPSPALDVDLVTFSCERDRLLVARMLDSFFCHAGRPTSVTVIDDGSLTPETSDAIRSLSPVVSLAHWGEFKESLPDASAALYAEKHPLGRKLLAIAALPLSPSRPTVFVDSDVEFFSGASRLSRYCADPLVDHAYMREPTGSGYDTRLLGDGDLADRPGINSGFLILRKPLPWKAAVLRLGNAAKDPGPWTEQTVCALALADASARELPMSDFVVSWDDLKYPWDQVAGSDVVCRHYLSWLQRWKMWMRGGPRGRRTLPRAVFRVAGGPFRAR